MSGPAGEPGQTDGGTGGAAGVNGPPEQPRGSMAA